MIRFFSTLGFLTLMSGIMLTASGMENTTATNTTAQCVTEGNMTNGTVAPEYQTQCCAGLASTYSYASDPNAPVPVGGGSLCYNPSKGMPVCKNNNATNEGRYYPDGSLLNQMNCQVSASDPSTTISNDNAVDNEDAVMCTMDYRPVCGTKDGKIETYGNACGLGAAKAQQLHDGECAARSSVTLSNKTLASIGNAVLAVFKDTRQSDGRLTAAGRERAQVIADRLAKLLEQHKQTMMVSKYTPSGYQSALTKGAIIQALYQEISVLVAPKSSCSAYTDGCNTCTSGNDGADACTLMMCKLPAEKIPHCLNN